MQGSTDIGNLSFQCLREGRQLSYEHSESVRGFQEAIAVVDEDLGKDLTHANFFSLLLDESTDIAVDHNCYVCALCAEW
jgi:hypothetical protein